MGASQALHFGEQEAEMLGVDALLAFGNVAADGGPRQRRLGQRRVDDGVPVGLQRQRSTPMPAATAAASAGLCAQNSWV